MPGDSRGSSQPSGVTPIGIRICGRKNWPMPITSGANRAARSERVMTAANRPSMVNCRMRAQPVRARRPKSAVAPPVIEKVRGRPNTAAWIRLAITSDTRAADGGGDHQQGHHHDLARQQVGTGVSRADQPPGLPAIIAGVDGRRADQDEHQDGGVGEVAGALDQGQAQVPAGRPSSVPAAACRPAWPHWPWRPRSRMVASSRPMTGTNSTLQNRAVRLRDRR